MKLLISDILHRLTPGRDVDGDHIMLLNGRVVNEIWIQGVVIAIVSKNVETDDMDVIIDDGTGAIVTNLHQKQCFVDGEYVQVSIGDYLLVHGSATATLTATDFKVERMEGIIFTKLTNPNLEALWYLEVQSLGRSVKDIVSTVK